MTPQRPAPAGVPGFRHRQGRLAEPRTARHTLSKSAAFRVTVAMMVLFTYASAVATPLYGVYQARWGFSAATLTAVFAIYMLFLLATLLVFGSLSDHIGRRPLIIAAIAVNVAAFVLFLVASSGPAKVAPVSGTMRRRPGRGRRGRAVRPGRLRGGRPGVREGPGSRGAHREAPRIVGVRLERRDRDTQPVGEGQGGEQTVERGLAAGAVQPIAVVPSPASGRLQSRTRCPSSASLAAAADSARWCCSTSASGVPAGTSTSNSTRTSMLSSF